MAILKIHKDFIKREGEEIVGFILGEFNDVLEVTTIGDVVDGVRCYIINDPRISKECERLDVTFTTMDIPDHIKPEQIINGRYQDKYFAWWDDGSNLAPFVETCTISELERSLDFQLDEYNKHKESNSERKDLLMFLVMGFIEDLGKRIENLRK